MSYSKHPYRTKSAALKRAYKHMRIHLLILYGKQCMRCSSKEEIQIDHIKPFSRYPEEAYNIKNAQLLCKKCNYEKGVQETDYRTDDDYMSLIDYLRDKCLNPYFDHKYKRYLKKKACKKRKKLR